MKSNSSIASMAASRWPNSANGLTGAHDLRGLLALACPALSPVLLGKGNEKQADEQRQDREHDFGSVTDFCSKALAGSGGM